MIVPRANLILLAGLTLIPLVGAAVSLPGFALPAAGLVGAIVLVAAIDAFLGIRNLKTLHVHLPAKLRWVQGRNTKLEVVFESRSTRPMRLRIGFDFPPELRPREEEMIVDLPAQAGKHHVLCDCLPTQRGLFKIEGCYYEAKSPVGLWDIRDRNLQSVEVRIYPNLESERKQVASLFLRTNRTGMRAMRQLGQGREFEKLREYVPGDGYDTIHWKATARRGHPITKLYQTERTQEVYVVIDASRLSARLQVPGDPSQGTHLDRYIAATMVLGLAAEKQGDLFGLLTFGDRVFNFVRARNGKEHYSACREALYRLEPQSVSPDFEEIATFIRLRLRRRALLVFMTDLDDPIIMESFQRSADLICRKHLLLVQMLQTENVRPVFSNAAVATVDDVYQDLAHHLAWHDLRQLSLSLQQHGVTLSLISREAFSAQTTSNYLRVKQRQIL
ncbi:MAG TPA: DUF58 domain-containing protein [Candidatus Methylacidiphilales bacterium]|jgi:uncharacterized protein (DUF58 family)|nr:DUF58 domain-containing protein [Candidatus Methylacidiphilales bacterium]